MNTLKELIKSGKATIVDVRSPAEYLGGHVAGSINLPLQELPDRIHELKGKQHIYLCCASGNRSGAATAFLRQNGFDCENGGSWLDIKNCC